MGNTACIKLWQILANVEHILAIELASAAQGIDFRREVQGDGAALGRGTGPVYRLIRQTVPFVEQDIYLGPLVKKVQELISSGKVEQAILGGIQ